MIRAYNVLGSGLGLALVFVADFSATASDGQETLRNAQSDRSKKN